MSTLRISDAPLLPDIDGTEKIPTGGRGDYAISIDQIKDHIFQDIGKELVGLGNVDNTSDLDKPVSTAQQAALDLKADKTYVDTNLDLKADKTNVYTRSETSLALSKKADLVNGIVPESQIPSSFNDVLEFTTSTLPIVGESGKIYVTTDTNRTWRWSSNQYVEISNGGVSDSTQKLQTPRKIANVDFDGTQNIDIPHNNLVNRNVMDAHTAASIGTANGENQQDINDYNGAKWRNKVGGYGIGDRVKLNSGITVESTVNSNNNNPNSDLTGWVAVDSSVYIKTKNPIATALDRTIQNRFNEEVSIKDFGAIGDGTLHTLQEWVDSGKFSGLAAIQAAFPFVTSLSQSIDWCATQYCVKSSPNVFCPKGNYVLSDVVKTNHATTPRDIGVNARGVRIFGDGIQTTFSRADARPATKTFHNSGPYTTQDSDLANLNEACFSIHAPFTIISDLAIGNSAVAFYFGQDFSVPFTSLSSVAYSSISNISISNCGTGLLMLAVGGNHYVNFSNIHFTGCQIDLDMRASYWWGVTQGRGDANNNRNTFMNIRSDRANVGTWIDCGDSNNLIGWRGESMPSVANTFPMPIGLPSEVVRGTLHVLTRSNQLNNIAFGFSENVAMHVYNDGYQNSFLSNGFDESLVIMKKKPKEWSGRSVRSMRGISVSDNLFSAFPEIFAAGALLLGHSVEDGQVLTNGVRVVTKDFWHQPKTNLRGSFEREFQIETGAISANTPVAFTIWGNVDASTSGMIELDVVGRCDVTGQTSTYIVKALANVYKASTRVPSRYSIHRILASRTTSQGVGDTTESAQISTTLQINPTVGQELQIVVSCPQDLTSATIFVKQKAAK